MDNYPEIVYLGEKEYPQKDGVFPLIDPTTGKRVGKVIVRRQDYVGVPAFYQAWYEYDPVDKEDI